MRFAIAAGLAVLGLLGPRARPAGAQEVGLDEGTTAVRIRLGVGDREIRSWDGRVRVDRGEVVRVDPWRFRRGQRIVDGSSWEASSLPIRTGRPAPAGRPQTGPGGAGPVVTPTGVVATLDAPDDATLTVETPLGEASFPLADLRSGRPLMGLEGAVEARLAAPCTPIAEGESEEDFPAAAPDGEGGAWVAYVEHEPFGWPVSEALTERPRDFDRFVPEGGGDRIRLIRFTGGKAGEPRDVTPGGRDVWRPAVAVDGSGRVVVVWSEFRGGDWDLYGRRYDPRGDGWSDEQRLTRRPGNHADVVLATSPDGVVWMAWQTWVAGQSEILLSPVDRVDDAVNISEDPGNDWAPSLAVGEDGTVFVAYDTYRSGNYDVMLASFDGRSIETVAVAESSLFEARPSVAVDLRGRAWVAYEERDAHWGKDAENLIEGEGATLYRNAAIRVRCVEGKAVKDGPDPVANAPESDRRLNSYPRLSADPSGRLWLLYRHKQEAVWGRNAVMVVGGVWVEFATSLAGDEWDPPRFLPRSDGLLDNRPAIVARAEGPPLAFYNTDNRMHREVEFTSELRLRFYSHSGTPPGAYGNDLFAAVLGPVASGPVDPRPVGDAGDGPEVAPVHPNEADAVDRMRSYRIAAGGTTYQFLRGEFHRHTELSQDGGADGSLEDMWRYAIDAGGLDWIGNGDHDNGGGKEYTWWLVQKTTDLYHNPPTFVPMFTYERSVGYPGGHRNVMFAYRGVRTLPRLIGEDRVQTDVGGRDLDAAMLYDYLNALDGICAAHTSATGMGTDWRQNDPRAEPFVEIFQGHRQSYEHLGAPKSARRPGESIGGWRPLGMVWNALAMQYRLGFQASSDHISTHISYAVALAERPTRESILDAFRRRHCYGATDNILLDVRCGDRLMGDEFDLDGPVTLDVYARGTAPIARVDIIKDFVHVYSSEPGRDEVRFAWTDEEDRPPGVSWYYVRILQEDGEIAWGSPMWIRTE